MKVLIVDDDLVCRTLLQEILAAYGTCHLVADGTTAIRAFEEALRKDVPFDLVCLDIMMPEMDGQETLVKIRDLERKNGLDRSRMAKILMITALSDPKNIMQAFIKGNCEGYITKPINPSKLLREIEKLGIKLKPVSTDRQD